MFPAFSDPMVYLTFPPIPLHTAPPASQPCRDVFPFLTLPAELRIQIYEAAFELPFEIDTHCRRLSSQPYIVPAALLRTCRQIYYEANHVLYERNTFRVGSRPDDANYGISWLARIGDNVKLIRKVAIDIYKNKTESRVLPFAVFMFELRSAAPQLEELSVFVEKHGRARSTGQFDILLELQKWSNLKKLTLGGEWRSFLGLRPDLVFSSLKEKHENVYFVEVGSDAWVERQEARQLWKDKIEKQAEVIRWKIGLERVGRWAEEKTKGLSDSLKTEWENWLVDCLRVECEDDRRLTIQRGKQIVLKSRAYSEKQARQMRCNCRDCGWVRENGQEWEKRMSCFEIHERVAINMEFNRQVLQRSDSNEGEAFRTNPCSSATIGQIRNTPERSNGVDCKERGRERSQHAGLNANLSSQRTQRRSNQDANRQQENTCDAPMTLSSQKAVPREKTLPQRFVGSEQLETPFQVPSQAGPGKETFVQSRLRRETRRWYGRPPVSQIPMPDHEHYYT